MTHNSEPSAQRRALLLGALGLGITAAGSLLPSLAQANNLVLGQAAPPLILHTLDGHSIATNDLIGHLLIVTFWASYCEPCREELPLLSAYAEQHAKQGLRVLGFSLDDPGNLNEVKEIAKTLSFPVGLLGSPYAGGYGRIWRMPVSFVIDRAGRLVDNGWDDEQPVWTKERLRRVVDPLLAVTHKD
ncbi:TlpA disulfide reductase family protein [Solimicrobium silvestre]|uniref:AhpC/TSA family n=1 Tax=Solimicrobium silvestre TaxID=2099400 RepID=A0A2S9GSG8_9BURK|nr:TlpA disulfide reductase family protein [Solimicrobium silvestre]PRC90664.1 AhpC/TSA family [Solimicrobium silvestre]